jgi:hypothetical protein
MIIALPLKLLHVMIFKRFSTNSDHFFNKNKLHHPSINSISSNIVNSSIKPHYHTNSRSFSPSPPSNRTANLFQIVPADSITKRRRIKL